nr:phosphoglycerate kinase [Aerococcus mictus]
MGLLQPHGRHRCRPRQAALKAVGLRGLRFLVRADLNVPMAEGRITDTTRIDRVASTLTELADRGAKVVVLSHFGRPKGAPEAKYSLAPVAAALGGILGRKVTFGADCIGPEAKKAVDALPEGGIVVLENTRFHPGEENNDPAFAKALAEKLFADKKTALDTLVREELGIDPQELGGSAWGAAGASLVLFSVGAIFPVAPYFFLSGTQALLASLAASGAALAAIGAGTSLFTGRGALFSAMRQLFIGFAAAGVTYGIGHLVGVSLAG